MEIDYTIDSNSGHSLPEVIKAVDWVNVYGRKVTSFCYRPEAVAKALGGDQRYVTWMFTWAETPKDLNKDGVAWSQCQDHTWYDGNTIHHSKYKPLSEEQRAFLRWLIRPEVEDKGE